MFKKIFFCFFFIIQISIFSEPNSNTNTNLTAKPNVINIQEKYNNLNLKTVLDYSVFEKAYLGYLQIPNKSSEMLVIIDYTIPSSEKRFFVLDLNKNKLLYYSRIAHSKTSGVEIPIKFSNDPNSFENSLGFYLTLDEYNGAFGHSLRLRGLEENINSNAEERAIVLHGGDIANDSYLKTYGMLGRSLGCPVLPTNITSEVISLIKNGTVIFINGNDESYQEESKFLKSLNNFSLKI